MSYREEMEKYLDPQTGLFGWGLNQAGYSTGNTLLETATAYILLKDLDVITNSDKSKLEGAIAKCDARQGNFYYRNPNKDSVISHDDVIGLISVCSILGMPLQLLYILAYGHAHFWILSSTGKLYWDAIVKPWHKAFYLLVSPSRYGPTCGLIGKLWLSAYILFDAYFNKTDMSGKKLIWHIFKASLGKSKIVDYALKIWEAKTQIAEIFTKYYPPNHLFSDPSNK